MSQRGIEGCLTSKGCFSLWQLARLMSLLPPHTDACLSISFWTAAVKSTTFCSLPKLKVFYLKILCCNWYSYICALGIGQTARDVTVSISDWAIPPCLSDVRKWILLSYSEERGSIGNKTSKPSSGNVLPDL